LQAYARGRKLSVVPGERARIILLAAEDKENREIAVKLMVSCQTPGSVAEWVSGIGMIGIDQEGLVQAARTLNADEIVCMTTQQKPDIATHGSTRSMALSAGVSEARCGVSSEPPG
jgi:hypothetical protein